MNLVCEKCDIAMRTVFYEGVAIQLCMSCKGAFLSQKNWRLLRITVKLNFIMPPQALLMTMLKLIDIVQNVRLK